MQTIITVLVALGLIPLVIEGVFLSGVFLRANRKDRKRECALEAMMPQDAADHAQVLLMMYRTKGLEALVLDAVRRIRRIFPSSTVLSLEFVPAYSGIDDHNRLFLKIQTTLPGDLASQLLDVLDAWWIPQSNKADGKLSICLEFR